MLQFEHWPWKLIKFRLRKWDSIRFSWGHSDWSWSSGFSFFGKWEFKFIVSFLLGRSIAVTIQVGVVERSANNALNCVEKWMAPKKVSYSNLSGKPPLLSDEIVYLSFWGYCSVVHGGCLIWLFEQNNLPLLFFPAKGGVIPEPFGTVLIISSWNFPFCKFTPFLNLGIFLVDSNMKYRSYLVFG